MNSETIAYFSMEIALEEGIPTYSGGLGILAGDMLRSAVDLKLPISAVTLLYQVYAGKAHSQDQPGKDVIKYILQFKLKKKNIYSTLSLTETDGLNDLFIRGETSVSE